MNLAAAIQNDINDYCENLVQWKGGFIAATSNLTVRIEKLPTEQQRRESYARWADAVYSIDITRIPFNGRGRIGIRRRAADKREQAHVGGAELKVKEEKRGLSPNGVNPAPLLFSAAALT